MRRRLEQRRIAGWRSWRFETVRGVSKCSGRPPKRLRDMPDNITRTFASHAERVLR